VRVAGGIVRSFGVAAVTLAFCGLAELLAITALCPRHRAWLRNRQGRSEVILDSGYRTARPGDAIYACTTAHRVGSVTLHEDLGCYCAPADLGATAIGLKLGGQCVVDQPHPAAFDDRGACRHARCDDHIDP